jgi:hypothetical protein
MELFSINRPARDLTEAFYNAPDVDAEMLYYHPTTGKLEWQCKHCPKRYTLNGRRWSIVIFASFSARTGSRVTAVAPLQMITMKLSMPGIFVSSGFL